MKKDTKEWIKFVENNSNFDVKCITFNELGESDWGWNVEGNIQHRSGKFYTIEGIHVNINGIEWEQPIINQPELGILGILMRIQNDQREYYLQLKAEPGNINKYQLSPTVQATRSNYSRVHEGKETKYLEYFVDNNGSVVDRLQTEQGGRFYRKRNRNIITMADLYVPLANYPEKYFRWFTSHEIRDMLREDNIINMDARSVLSCDWASRKSTYDFPIYTMNDLLNWFNRMKFDNTLETKLIPLAKVKNWIESKMEIHDKEMKHFSINAVKVNTDNREVSNWTQPMIFEKNQGLVGFITTFINEQRHYLIHARIEPGSMDKMYVAPSVQCSNYDYKKQLPLFADILLDKSNIKLYDSIQSEEGGRFYHFQNRHLIVEVNGFDWEDIPNDYMWATSEQLKDFINYGLLNIEARSLITGYLFR